MKAKRMLKKKPSEITTKVDNATSENKIVKVEELQVDPDEEEKEEVSAVHDTDNLGFIDNINEKENQNLEGISKSGVIEGSASSNCGFPDLNDSEGDHPPRDLII